MTHDPDVAQPIPFASLVAEYSSKNSKPFSTLSPGSAGKYLWECTTCHYEWESRISHRLTGSSVCPFCSKKILSASNPELAKEWGSKNSSTPADHKPGSRERVWWKCSQGLHEEYLAAIANRRLRGTACPKCKEVPPGKSVTDVAPQLRKQWSSKNQSSPENTYANAKTKIIWECDICSYEWSTRVSYRTEKDRGCPKCNQRLLEGKTVADVLPQLVTEWSDKNPVSPNEISATSNKLIIWVCPKGHGEYKMRPVSRKEGSYCPECVLDKKSLAITEPLFASEWHPTKNGTLTPQEVSRGSSYKAWWLCDENHEWYVSVSARTSRQTGCPVCAQSSISSVETRLREDLSRDGVLQNIQQEHSSTLSIPVRNRRVIKVDILGTYKGYPVVIEYDGWYWHSGQRKKDAATPFLRDTEKTQGLLEAGFIVVRIREQRKNQILDFLPLRHPALLQTHWVDKKDTSDVRKVIYEWLGSLPL